MRNIELREVQNRLDEIFEDDMTLHNYTRKSVEELHSDIWSFIYHHIDFDDWADTEHEDRESLEDFVFNVVLEKLKKDVI